MLKLWRIRLLMLILIMIMILCQSKLHMLKYVQNVPHICGIYMQHICRKYAPHILPNFAYFSAYFASKLSAYFNKILRYKPTSLTESKEIDELS